MKDKKISIGLFCDSFFPMIDGVVNVVDNYAKCLNKIANVTVFVPQGRDKEYVGDFPYKVVRCKKRFNCPGLDYDLPLPEMDIDFLDELNASKLDIVHIHSPFSLGKLGVNYAKKHKIPVVATLHSQFKQDFYEATHLVGLTNILLNSTMSTFNGCDICWAVNEGIADLYRTDYKLKAPLAVQYNATDMKKHIFSAEDVQKFDEKYDIKPDEHVLCFVGRLTVLKNILFIVDALKILKDKGFKFKMFFVGTGTDEDKLKEAIVENDLQNEVILTGRFSNKTTLGEFYNRAELLLFPSPYDTDGLVKYEAACYSTPVVSIKGFHCASNITDNVTGYLTSDSAQEYAEKIIEIFANPELYAQVCQNCNTELYRTWDKAIDKIYADYIDIIHKYKQGYYKQLKKFVINKNAHTKKIKSKQKQVQKKQAKLNKINEEKIEKLEKMISRQNEKIEKLRKKIV